MESGQSRMRGWVYAVALMAMFMVPASRSAAGQSSPGQQTGALSGTVKDVSGVPVADATVTATGPGGFLRKTNTDGEGEFRLAGLPAGEFALTVTMAGLANGSAKVTLAAGEQKAVPGFALGIATVTTQVDAMSQVEMAEVQIKAEEHQRLLGIIPNFYVAYDPNTVPMTGKQKYKLALRTVIDPTLFASTAINAGINQARNQPVDWTQDAAGFGKRYGAAYAGSVVGVTFSGALAPSVFHQDPRYFYKGTGSFKSRFVWSAKQAVEQKSDRTGKWQPAYSNMLGDVSASVVTTTIYPHDDVNWSRTVPVNFLLGIAAEGVGDLLEEFVFNHVTTRKH